jgi:hypothetical protein
MNFVSRAWRFIIALGGFLIDYFFGESELQPVAQCGDCHCFVSENETCPPKPQTNFSDDLVSGLMGQRLLTDVEGFGDCNPYENPDCASPFDHELGPDSVCGIHYKDSECTEYHLKTYANWAAAEEAGAHVTHIGACGLCSSTTDLGVYMSVLDMTTRGTKCSQRSIVFGVDEATRCFQDIGYTLGCSQIWAYNARNSAKIGVCLIGCLVVSMSGQPFNGPAPECTLNSCLQCDEEKNGPIFKKYCGRTRRNSGMLSAIARPCDEIAQVRHEVCPDTLPLE